MFDKAVPRVFFLLINWSDQGYQGTLILFG